MIKLKKARVSVAQARNLKYKKCKIEELSSLLLVCKSITSSLKLSQVLSLITAKSAEMMQAKASSLRLLNKTRKELQLKAFYGQGKKMHFLKGNLRVGESIAGRVVKSGKHYIIKNLYNDSRYKDMRMAKRQHLCSMLSVPLFERGRPFGVLSIYSQHRNFYDRSHADILAMFAAQAAIAISNAKLYEQTKVNYMDAIRFLSNALDAKDRYTLGHSERVAEIALNIAVKLGLTEAQKDAVQYASYLHDVGKVGVDSRTLSKPGALDKDEWEEVARHPMIGARLVSDIGILHNLVPTILHHHAHYAGGGYPDRNLKHHDIPIGARILAVADAYEAMVSDRPYRRALTHNCAIRELKRCAGKQFDPCIVTAFLKVINDGNLEN
jgi:HD-GYP domain-containing protein (c-di-GMP phosphodiesterase class II)